MDFKDISFGNCNLTGLFNLFVFLCNISPFSNILYWLATKLARRRYISGNRLETTLNIKWYINKRERVLDAKDDGRVL